jgi:hypothetical protein
MGIAARMAIVRNLIGQMLEADSILPVWTPASRAQLVMAPRTGLLGLAVTALVLWTQPAAAQLDVLRKFMGLSGHAKDWSSACCPRPPGSPASPSAPAHSQGMDVTQPCMASSAAYPS